MRRNKVIEELEAAQLKADVPDFGAGDTVVVQVKVREGNRERLQAFEGVVIGKRNRGLNSSFTVRKISYGVGVERIFPVESPAVKRIEIKSRGHVRRSRLYYLRELRGKKARLRSKLRDLSALVAPEEAEARAEAEAAVLPAAEPDPEAPQEEAAAAPEVAPEEEKPAE